MGFLASAVLPAEAYIVSNPIQPIYYTETVS